MSGGTRPRPLRALARVQAEMAWNRARRESGAGGMVAAAFVLLVAVLAFFPPVVGSVLVGHALGHALVEGDDGEALFGLSAFHVFVVWFFGLVGLVGAGRPRFTDPRFRVYPLPRRSLLVAELAASLLDFVPLLGIGCLGGLAAGLSFASGRLGLVALPVIAGGAWSLLLVYQACSAVQRILLKRPRPALALVLLVAASALVVAHVATPERGLELVHGGLARFIAWQPSSAAWALVEAQVSERRADGRWGALGFPLALFAASVAVVRLLVFEADLEPRGLGRTQGVGPERLWSFRRPREGIARLYASQVLAHSRGRLLVFGPAIGATVAALAARLVPPAFPELAAEPGAIRSLVDLSRLPLVAWFSPVVVALSADLWANQFGPDGHGIKTLFGLPVPHQEIVRGKLLGLGRLFALQTGLALPALLWQGEGPAVSVLHGIGAGAFAVIFLAGVGMLFSARFPHRATGQAGEPGATPFASLVIPLGAVILCVPILLGTELIARGVHPQAPPLAMLLLALLSWIGWRAALPFLARRVAAEQERLVSELG